MRGVRFHKTQGRRQSDPENFSFPFTEKHDLLKERKTAPDGCEKGFRKRDEKGAFLMEKKNAPCHPDHGKDQVLPDQIHDLAKEGIGGRNGSRICLKGALHINHIDEFFTQIHVGQFKSISGDIPKRSRSGCTL